MRNYIRNMILGSQRIPSRQEYKFAMLRAEFAALIAFVAVFYAVLDFTNNMHAFYGWYAIMLAIALLSILLNRAGHYNMANFFILTTINVVIFLFADVDRPQGGVYFFFTCASVAGLILFSNGPVPVRLFFGLLPIPLALLARLFDLNIIPPPSADPAISSINFLANLTIGMLTTALMVTFLISRHRESERSLLESQQAITAASEKLKLSEERYAMALQGTRAGIYEWLVKENRVEVSPHWKSLLGYSPSEMLNVRLETFLTMVHPDDAERTSASVMNHVKNQLPYQNEVRMRTKDGEYRWFQDSGIGKSDASGSLEVVIGSIIDIHERKEAEEKIRQQNDLLAKANKELDRFVYSVSHDLRAPLSSILGLTSIFSMSKTPGEKDEVIRMIRDRANVLDEFIREVLDYSRNSRQELKHQPVMLWEVVDEALNELAHMDGFGALSIRTAIPSELTVTADRERLKVILSNLFSNAIKYRDRAKESFVSIKAIRNTKEWQMEIQDNGMGIRKEHLPHIFEMFYKAHETSQGTGLGLYIVQEAIHRMKGTIEVNSIYGEGTTFRLIVET